MLHPHAPGRRGLAAAAPFVVLPLLAACDTNPVGTGGGDDGSNDYLEDGQRFFREGTFGTEAFWTDAAQLPRGLFEAGFTTLDALSIGLQIDSEVVDPELIDDLVDELGTDLAGQNAPLLNDPGLFQELLTGNAFVGLVADDLNSDGFLSAAAGETLGLSCALCHSIVDGSDFDGNLDTSPVTGSIGARVDGPGAVLLDHGALLAVARNSLALYPQLPLSLATIGGQPIARTDAFVSGMATEFEADEVLLMLDAFPFGQADMLPDGIGAPVTIPPVYQARPVAPYGVTGEFRQLVDFINFHVLVGLDPTTIVDEAGAEFLDDIAPGIGTQISNETEAILDRTGVIEPLGGYPYVDAPLVTLGGTEDYPFGRRMDDYALRTMAIYVQQLRAPAAPDGDPGLIAQGESVYWLNCADCHGDPVDAAPRFTVPLDFLFLNYSPTTLLVRGFPYTHMLDDVLTTYDDRAAIFDRVFEVAQVPLIPREFATRRLAGLHLRRQLLHDGSVPDLETLLDPLRGPAAAHPFYVSPIQRDALIEFLTTR